MAAFLGMMIGARDRKVMTGWDLVIAIAGAVAALVAAAAIYVHHTRRTRREQGVGESLRDQLKRCIAQLDDRATSARVTTELVLVVMGGICPMAVVLLGLRINQQALRDNAFLAVGMLVMCVVSVAAGIWENRREVKRDVLPRKHRLEALLKELDGP